MSEVANQLKRWMQGKNGATVIGGFDPAKGSGLKQAKIVLSDIDKQPEQAGQLVNEAMQDIDPVRDLEALKTERRITDTPTPIKENARKKAKTTRGRKRQALERMLIEHGYQVTRSHQPALKHYAMLQIAIHKLQLLSPMTHQETYLMIKNHADRIV